MRVQPKLNRMNGLNHFEVPTIYSWSFPIAENRDKHTAFWLITYKRILKERKVNGMVRITAADEITTAYLIGEIDHHEAKDIREEIDGSVERSLPRQLVLDFKDVTFMDSSGIGLVMGRYKLMQSLDGDLKLQNLPGHIKKVMKLAGLDQLGVLDDGGKTK